VYNELKGLYEQSNSGGQTGEGENPEG
jgi:hypothetical protein